MDDISIVGLGVLNVDHLTRQTEQVIRDANEVLFVDNGLATRQYLESLCPRVTSLYEESYHESACRLGSYDHMAATVIDAALDHAPIVFAMSGHPTVGAEAPFLIHELARLLELSVVTLPGISAMDSLFADLMIDPCRNGIQMYEGTDLLLRRYPLVPEVPVLVWQIGALETRLHTNRRSNAMRFERFKNHVLRFYPPTHRAIAAFASPHPLMRPQRVEFSLQEIDQHAAELHSGFTLYIPPTGLRAIQDRELLHLIDSQEHLDRITTGTKSG